MRVQWGRLVVEAIDYELVRITPLTLPAVGSFSDVHVTESPRHRLVAGYLMLEQTQDEETLQVYSHGRPVARLLLGGHELGVSFTAPALVRRVDAEPAAGVLTPAGGGVALVPEDGVGWKLFNNGTAITESGRAWAVTVVHGPAEAKIDNRVRLLRSLQRVGGRRG